MTSNDPFKLLGLEEAEATLKAIKKAYSVKLKEARPDDDPEGFMALREAYTQAQNRVRWKENNPPLQPVVSQDTGADQSSPHEIKYWYDEELNYHFNSSPNGKLTEKTVKWIRKDQASDPETFFRTLAEEPILEDENVSEQYTNFLLSEIYFAAGGEDYYDDDEFTDEPAYECPTWLCDDVIIAIYKYFNPLSLSAEYEWNARQLNCAKELFEPVLIEKGYIKQRSKKFDLLKYRAKEMNEQNKDEFGSHYDTKTRRWIDMSPIGRAMRDIEELIESPWAAAGVEKWKEITSREELQVIDQFQQFDNRLRHFITNHTGYGENQPNLLLPGWLSKEVVLHLDETFGWSHQTPRNTWEYDHYRWLFRIINRFRPQSRPAVSFKSWEDVDRNSYEFLGYQPLPIILNPIIILGTYALIRIFQLLLG